MSVDALPSHDVPQPFLTHMEALRRAMLGSLASLVAGMLVAFPLAPAILAWLRVPLEGVVPQPDRFLGAFEITSGFTVALQTAFWGGLLFSSPLIVLFVAGFVFPGLTMRERQVVRRAAVFAVALFAAGVAFGYGFTLRAALRAMFWFNDWLSIPVPFIRIGDYIMFTTQLLIGFGLAFEVPVLIVSLGYLGILTSDQLRAKRRHMIVAILIAAAVLTPPDVFSQTILAVPLLVLYEVCIWIIRARERLVARSAP